MGDKVEKAPKAKAEKHAPGVKLKFKTGRSATEYTATVTGHDGTFYTTKDAEGVERKTRGGVVVD